MDKLDFFTDYDADGRVYPVRIGLYVNEEGGFVVIDETGWNGFHECSDKKLSEHSDFSESVKAAWLACWGEPLTGRNMEYLESGKWAVWCFAHKTDECGTRPLGLVLIKAAHDFTDKKIGFAEFKRIMRENS
jgi:hypothetical protein